MLPRNLYKPILSCLRIGADTHNSSLINCNQIRTSVYNKYRHGPMKRTNPSPDYVQWVKSFFSKELIEFLKGDFRKIIVGQINRPVLEKTYLPDKTYIFEHFDSDESILAWKPLADSDSRNGFSTATISRSKAGHALFKGELDTTVPDDGLSQMSGFVAIAGPRRPRDKLLEIENFWNWELFNALEIKFRGDGRKYRIVINTASYTNDLSFYDNYSFPLYTRGGPYWQVYRIPFSRFIYSSKNFIQDVQPPLPTTDIKFVSITLADQISGPYELEIDYIGLRNETRPFDEHSCYEMYTFPHIRFTLFSPGCDPPDDS